jgi:Rad3-related DNA helicase
MDVATEDLPPLTVAVRTLCEFTAKAGDLDVRFTPAPTAIEGIEGHAVVASRRGAGYQKEIPLSGRHGELLVRGRADGFDADKGRLEEVKTHRGAGALARQPANHRALHWAQAMVYGWLLCARDGLERLELALVYYDIGSRQETVFTQTLDAEALRQHFVQRCEAYIAWARLEHAHRRARDAALAVLRFPHSDFRTGQRPLAEAVFKVARAGRPLMAQAPTGIGKTIGTVFPLLRALPGQQIDRVFFLTAKTSGRALALDAVATLRRAEPDLPLRALELVAREKACEHPDKACHGESCPLAEGFYDRLPAAREAALAVPVWHREGVRAVAAAHGVCPYYLGQELARWADLVIGDYNHFFDLSAMLHALTQINGWRVALLLDEAHNLVDRARLMHTGELDQLSVRGLRHTVPKALQKPLDKLNRVWKALNASESNDGVDNTYRVLPALPDELMTAIQQAATAVIDHLVDHPTTVDAALQGFLFDALHLTKLAESFGPHSLCDLTPSRDGRTSVLCLRNVVPAPFLGPRWAVAHTATLFSATLQPPAFHRDLLGLPEQTAWIDVASPFERAQLDIHIARDISTRWQHRDASVAPIVALIAAQYAERPGNYLAFFSSFDYLDRVAVAFEAAHPDVPVWKQARRMSEPEQAAFLARFAAGGRGVGFAVLGGAFAEGIDLPGDRLIGAFIATLGLPQVNPVNEQIRRRLDTLVSRDTGSGFDCAYLFPGVQKVVQAAGRVIRTPQDRGVVHLIDDRFAGAQVQGLMPRWWGLGQRSAEGE